MIRTHDAGALRAEHVGQTVTLAGWVARRRDHGGVTFIDLREASGVVQVVIREDAEPRSSAHTVCATSTASRSTGEVVAREAHNVNPNLPTGEIEVIAGEVEVLSEAAPLPFPVDEHVEVGEEARLKHRYLDLRRRGPGEALRLRSAVNRAARDVLAGHDFVEVETPTLTRSTPEGARDFLVPARLQPGSWYALPQSPQLFKQLLMVAGMERYYQIARCYRDEDFRADRQPEFTQLDVEMSFVDQDDVIALTEEILVALWKLVGYDVPTPLPRMTYAEAMARYGTDKPDLRMGLELTDCTDVLRRHAVPGVPGALRRRGGDARGRRPAAQAAGRAGRSGPSSGAPAAWPTCWCGEDGELGGPVAKNLSDQERAGLAAHVGAAAGRLRLLRRGSPRGRAGRCWARPGSRSAAAAGSSTRTPGASCGSSTLRCSSPPAEATAAGDVALGYSAWTAVHHAFTSPQGPRHLRPGPRQRAGVGLRHRLQRQRDRRRVDPYPPRGRAEAGLRGDGHRRGRGRGEVRLPPARRSSTARRRTAASRSAGTGSARCWRAPTRSAT